MAKDEKFMFFETFIKAIDTLPEDKRAEACYRFCRYGIYGELPEDEGLKMFCIGVSCSVQKYHGSGGSREGAGRPKKENQKNQINQKNQNIQIVQTETETETINRKETETGKIDIYADTIINKVFEIYKSHCTELVKLDRFYSRNIELKKLIGSYLEQTESDLEYFTRVCDIANRVKKIGSVNIDLKMILKNHDGFYNGKYQPIEEIDDYITHDDSDWLIELEKKSKKELGIEG